MSDADLSSAAPAADSTVPTFKRKKRPQAKQLLLRDTHSPSPAALPDKEGTPQSGFEGDNEDSTSETLDSLLALRRLKRSTAGLELDRLNAGERKKRPKPSSDAQGGGGDGTVVTEGAMIEGTHGGLRAGGKDRLRDDGDAPEAKARKIVKSDNFTGQTNTVDVDKHMLAYIDAELARKRGTSTPDASAAAASNKPYDPRDDLYRVADKYKFADVAAAEKGKKDKDEDEGNVTLSAGMLMGIPEVDLGIDTKLRNIEATELAKRKLHDDQFLARQKRREEGAGDQDEFAVDRFYRHRRPLESDESALERAKAEAARAADPANKDPDHHLRGKGAGGPRNKTATDDLAMARFKKRQQQQYK